MLKKSFALGVLAAMAMAPAAFAGDQVQGNTSNTQITTGNLGTGNVNGVTNSTNAGQYQGKYKSPFCATGNGNQIQGNVAATAINAANVGLANVSGIANSGNATQAQNSGCSW